VGQRHVRKRASRRTELPLFQHIDPKHLESLRERLLRTRRDLVPFIEQ
jgi:hypothetical protein